MKNLLSVLLMVVAVSFGASAQVNLNAPKTGKSVQRGTIAPATKKQCGYGVTTAAILQSHPAYAAELQAFQQAVPSMSLLNSNDIPANRSPNVVIEIPVVFHVLYHTGEAVGTGRNISATRIQNNLAIANTDYRKQNANWASGTPTQFKAVSADVQVHFCLATIDPNGNPTTGIDRFVMNTDPDSIPVIEDIIKPAHKWDPSRYLNIYIVPIPGTTASSGILGYSYIPFASMIGSANDGTVIDYRWLGNGTDGASGGGRTLTHEIGHYLGLAHIWADYNNVGGCTHDDGIADTPEQDQATSDNLSFVCTNGVNNPPVSCGNANMYVDYMDYIDDDACYTQFTQGQTNVMRAVLNGTAATYGLGSRTLLVNNGLTQCQVCATPITATIAKTDVTCSAQGTATVTATGGPATGTIAYAWSNAAATAAITNLAPSTYTVTVTKGTCTTIVSTTIANTCLTAKCDTVSLLTANDSARLYSTTNSTGKGYLSGNNQYGDLIKAEYFGSYTGAHTAISSVVVGFARAVDTAPASNFAVGVWDGTTGTPGALLGSRSFAIAPVRTAILAGNYVQLLRFNSPIALPASKKIFVGIILPTTSGDTIAIFTNQQNSAAAGTGTGWEKWGDNTWHNYNETAAWGIDLRNYIFPIFGTVPTATVGGPATATCNNSLTFSLTNAQHLQSVVWSIAGGAASTTSGTSTVFTTTPTQAGTYTVSAILTYGCISDTISKTLTVTCATCNLALTTNSTATTCGASNGSATVVATGGTTPYTYAWSNTATTATASPLAAGIYTVTVTAGVNCSSTKSATVGTSVAISATVTTTSTATGQSIGTATANPTPTVGTYTYAWSNNGTTKTIGLLAGGTYTVTVSNASGCTATAVGTVQVINGTSSIGSLTGFNVYPNPTNGKVQVNAEFATTTDVTLEVIDMLGRVVLHETNTQVQHLTETLSLSGFATGVYSVVLRTSDGTAVQKLTLTK